MTAPPPDADRRPLASRDTRWARGLSQALAKMGVSPNTISVLSLVAAAMAGAAAWGSGGTEGAARILLLLMVAIGCQLRLLCNLLDGLVAVEAGRRTPDGAFWNEMPDRASDLLILVGLGFGLGDAALGWAAGAFALATAYVREFGRASGLPADYRGPMAKPHRMATVTVAAILSCAEPLWGGQGEILRIALWVVLVGAGLTSLRRSARILRTLRAEG